MTSRKLIISIFISLNIFSVMFCNSPQRLRKAVHQKLNLILPSQMDKFAWLPFIAVQKYAQATGLSSRWTMFTSKDHANWRYVFKAKYTNSEIIELPLPNQVKRNLTERILFDFREVRILLSLNDSNFKKRYLAHLCNQYLIYNNSKIKSIILELYKQKILNIKEANIKRANLETNISKEIVETFNCQKLKGKQ